MNIPTPAQVASNRTARLVREAKTPVYTSQTTAREHLTAVEIQVSDGGRYWSSMPDSEVDAFCDKAESYGNSVSDIDHSLKCWCF